jgi:hypothetical protein
MGVVRMMATSVTAQTAANVVAARVAARQACDREREPTSGVYTAPSPLASDPELETAAERLRSLRERGLLTAHEFEVALDRVTGAAS